MTDTENIKLAIQAAWAVNEPAFALSLALRDHTLRGLCLQCANHYRRLQKLDEQATIICLICRQCCRDAREGVPRNHSSVMTVPTLTASVYTPPSVTARNHAVNSLWLDTTNLRAYIRRKWQWILARESEELFEQLGVEPDPIYQIMSSYASATLIDDVPVEAE